MKKFHAVFVFMFLSCFSILAQPTLEWENNWSGPIYNDEGKLIALDNQGNIYVAAVSDSITLKDWLIIKYNSRGEVQWTRRINGTANKDDEPLDIKIDNEGNVFVTGYVTNKAPTFESKDMFTIKLSSTGNIIWTKTSEEVWYGLKILIDVFGNVFVAGGFLNSYSYSVLYKYNSNGDLLWGKTIYIDYHQDGQTVKQMEFNSNGDLVILIQLYHAYSGGYYYDQFYVTEISTQTGDTVFNYYKNTGIAKSMVVDELNGDIYVASQINSGWYIFLYNYHIQNDVVFLHESSSERKIISFNIDKFYRFYILELWTGEPSIWKYDPNGSTDWFKNFDLIVGNNDFADLLMNIDENEDNPDILVTGNTSTGNILTFKVSNYNSEVIWEETYDCGNNKPDIANYLFVDDCDNIYITGSSACGNAYKDIKTIKYSTLDKPEIEVTGTLPLCFGEQVTLSVPSCTGCTYIWSSGQTTKSITVTPNETTTYNVTVTNSESCPVFSQPVEVIVNPLLTPMVTITSNIPTICKGEQVVFTASPVNGGQNPVFDWFINNSKISSGSSKTFTSSILNDGETVKCVLNSNAQCLTDPSATSNEITITVNPLLPVTANITVDDSEICLGNSATFTASSINGGDAPIYKWYVNDQLQNETSNNFTSSNLTNGAKVYASVTSNALCPDPEAATSNTISMIVNPLQTPTVSIAASSSSACQGQNITFTATPTNGGSNPTYKWYIGNQLQSDTTGIFTTNQLVTGSQVYCVMTSSEECLEIPTATSNFISVAVNSLVTPAVSISASSTEIFTCEQVTFTPSPVNSGPAPQYKWFVNGNLMGTSATFKTTSLTDGAKVHCVMTSNAMCLSSPTANSDTLTISVYPLPQPEITITNDTISVGNYEGSQYSFTWYYNGTAVSSSPFIKCHDNGNGSYYVIVSLNGCSVTSSTANITCSVGITETNNEDIFNIYPNPTSGFIRIDCINLTEQKYAIEIYNILGVKLAKQDINSEKGSCNNIFDISNNPSGNYFISIKGEKNSRVFKIQKY